MAKPDPRAGPPGRVLAERSIGRVAKGTRSGLDSGGRRRPKGGGGSGAGGGPRQPGQRPALQPDIEDNGGSSDSSEDTDVKPMAPSKPPKRKKGKTFVTDTKSLLALAETVAERQTTVLSSKLSKLEQKKAWLDEQDEKERRKRAGKEQAVKSMVEKLKSRDKERKKRRRTGQGGAGSSRQEDVEPGRSEGHAPVAEGKESSRDQKAAVKAKQKKRVSFSKARIIQ
ncbi:hypothetical protein DFJ74DRAFT_682259 [Hyaloraphidium curvatum]|nr:hypothetical protein DFJ74DRAFT_682259 [Hyaloraphidium curvatum]